MPIVEYPEFEDDLEAFEPEIVEVQLGGVWSPLWKSSSQVLAYKALMYQFKLVGFESDARSGYVCARLYDDMSDDLRERVIATVEAVFDSAGRG